MSITAITDVRMFGRDFKAEHFYNHPGHWIFTYLTTHFANFEIAFTVSNADSAIKMNARLEDPLDLTAEQVYKNFLQLCDMFECDAPPNPQSSINFLDITGNKGVLWATSRRGVEVILCAMKGIPLIAAPSWPDNINGAEYEMRFGARQPVER